MPSVYDELGNTKLDYAQRLADARYADEAAEIIAAAEKAIFAPYANTPLPPDRADWLRKLARAVAAATIFTINTPLRDAKGEYITRERLAKLAWYVEGKPGAS